MAKKKAGVSQNASMSVCVEKFELYATKRGITLDISTYGFYEVRRGEKKRILGAVKATKADGETGWVVNFADRQRKFVADSDNNIVIGKKKFTPVECAKYRKGKPKKVLCDIEEGV